MNLNDAEFAYANAVPETGETFHSMEQENSFLKTKFFHATYAGP